MACMTACPSGVDYGKLIEATRAQIERKYDRGRLERLYRRLIFGLFTRPERLRMMRAPLLLYQKTGLRWLVRRSGVLRVLPKRVQAMEALLPDLAAAEAVAEITPAVGEKQRRVGLLLGCVQREFFPQVNAATARVLVAEGCEVVSPADQPCCGALLVHAGEEEGALALARHLINVFERAGVDAIVTNAAGCGSNVKEYGHLLRDDPQYAARAKEFSAKCQDISETLAYMGLRAKRNELRLRVAFHDSCHLQHAQGVRTQPRQLLNEIPGLEIVEIPEAPLCCGSLRWTRTW
jgi:glycolate oxidase iron-sulfur subunit